MADYVIDFYLLCEHCAVSLEAFVKLWNHVAVRNDAFTTFGGGPKKSAAGFASNDISFLSEAFS